MSDTVHKQTVLSLVERDIENKYAFLKQNSLSILTSLSGSIPLLKIGLPSADKWLVGKERQFLPKVQDMVNACVEMSFVESDIGVEEAYRKAKQLFNDGLNEMICTHSQFSLESIDSLLEILVGSKLSL